MILIIKNYFNLLMLCWLFHLIMNITISIIHVMALMIDQEKSKFIEFNHN